MRPPCYYVLEEIVILEVIYGSLLWMVCNPAAPAHPLPEPWLCLRGVDTVSYKSYGFNRLTHYPPWLRQVWDMGPDAQSLPAAEAATQPAFMRLQGPNMWPSAPPEFKPAIGALVASIGAVCAELMEGAALALGQPADTFAGYFEDKDTVCKPHRHGPPSSSIATLKVTSPPFVKMTPAKKW